MCSIIFIYLLSFSLHIRRTYRGTVVKIYWEQKDLLWQFFGIIWIFLQNCSYRYIVAGSVFWFSTLVLVWWIFTLYSVMSKTKLKCLYNLSLQDSVSVEHCFIYLTAVKVIFCDRLYDIQWNVLLPFQCISGPAKWLGI